MMRLLLTSAGFENPKIGAKFVELTGKSASEIKVIFIPTASRTEEELKYVDEARKEILNTGILNCNIKTLNLDHHIFNADVKDFDAIYICGGNTFYLLKKVRESGFDQILHDYKGVYVGVSAGSIIVGPNIEVSAPWDENDVSLSNTTGLNIVNFAVVPHYQRKEHSIIENLKNQAGYEIKTLTDNQAYIVINGEAEKFS